MEMNPLRGELSKISKYPFSKKMIESAVDLFLQVFIIFSKRKNMNYDSYQYERQ
jgi:hypothetical protein